MNRSGLCISAIFIAVLGASPASVARDAAPLMGVGAQYDTTHVYVAPDDVDKFVASFTATFGGQSTKQVVATVTPTPSSTTSQLIQTPVGTVSVFGFKTPIPYPFGAERTGYLVTDLDAAIKAARAAGADVVVAAFPDPIGRDAVVQWPGGVNMQLYWHTTKLCVPKIRFGVDAAGGRRKLAFDDRSVQADPRYPGFALQGESNAGSGKPGPAATGQCASPSNAEATAPQQCGSFSICLALSLVSVRPGGGCDRQAGDHHSLAPCWVSGVLALAIPQPCWQTEGLG
jgi:hypothetical protein